MLVDELNALRQARRARTFVLDELPVDVSAAYAVAATTLARTQRPASAWKLGATTAGTRVNFSTETIYFGGLMKHEVWYAGESPPHVVPPVWQAEAEIAFRLARDIPASEAAGGAIGCSDDTLFDAWTPALEAPYSCIENVADAGLRALLSDRCASGALFLGPPREDVASAAIDSEIAILIGGQVAASGSAAAALLMSPIIAARGFLEQAGRHGFALTRGQWVSTGGITPCIRLPADGTAIGLAVEGSEVFTLALAITPEAAIADSVRA